MHLYAQVNSIEVGVGLLLVHLVGLLDPLVLVSYFNRYMLHFYHLPLWTKPTPNTLASYWASLSLFIFSSSALTHSLLVAGAHHHTSQLRITSATIRANYTLLLERMAQVGLVCKQS